MCNSESLSDGMKLKNRIVYRQLNYVKFSYYIETIANLIKKSMEKYNIWEILSTFPTKETFKLTVSYWTGMLKTRGN
jgi:hypothetical protein